jgi:putative ABC transport system permease protein
MQINAVRTLNAVSDGAFAATRITACAVTMGQSASLSGAAVGMVCAFGLTRFLASQLFGVQATDVMTFTLVTLLLVATMLLACYVPARRAAKVDPMTALRYE